MEQASYIADGKGRGERARQVTLPDMPVWKASLRDKDDAERMDALGINVQPFDVWNFRSCHDLMGDAYPGRIPGELVAHVLYFYTKPGDLVLDLVNDGRALRVQDPQKPVPPNSLSDSKSHPFASPLSSEKLGDNRLVGPLPPIANRGKILSRRGGTACRMKR